MQGEHLKAGGVLKTTWRKGVWDRQAGGDNEGTARNKRSVSGRSRSPEAGDRGGHFNQAVCKTGRNEFVMYEGSLL